MPKKINNTYTLFDGLAYNTCGYFASCVVFFRAPLLYAKPSNCYFAIGLYFFGKSIQKHPDVGNACLQESIPHKCHKGKGIIQGKLYSQVH